jgi:hypothetical protein
MCGHCDMIARPITAFALSLTALWLSTASARAFDLEGAWTSDVGSCPKIFVKSAASTTFAPNSEMWGTGFIVDGNNIRGQITKCVIKTRKEKGNENYVLASCASDIMVDQVQLNFKVNGNNSITRFFPGIEGMERTFVRCPF